MTRSRFLPLGGALVGVLLLSGCISLLPKQKPAQTYQFTAKGADAPAPAPGAFVPDERLNLVLPPPTFPRASAGDQLLSVTGRETAYIAGARWISPAQVLFEESTRRAFASRSTRTRLMGRGELGAADAFLRLDVGDFEVRYPAPDAAPTVHITLRALLTHKNGAFVAERDFSADAPASDNRVEPIVTAYSAAAEQVTTALLNWTDANATAAAASPPLPAGGSATTVTTSTSSSTTSVKRPAPR